MKRTLSIVLLLLLTLMAQAQTRHLRVYQRSGDVDTLTVTTGSAFTHSKTDLEGREQADYVALDVKAVGTTRRYLLADIDSLVLPGGRRVVFRGATMERQTDGAKALNGPRRTSISGDFPGTKGTGNVQFLWADNDPIRLDVGYESRAEQLSADKTSAQFVFDADDLDADAYTVYYPDKLITIPTVQTQRGADNSEHLGTSGDCGVATAQRGSDGNYSFTLAHKAAYFCFLPHIDHLPSVRLTSIDVEVLNNNDKIAGTYALSSAGLYNGENLTNKITLNLTPQKEKDFLLGHRAATEQDSVAAYMVIAPGNERTFTITYHLTDTLTHITRDILQTFKLTAAVNTVYTITRNIDESAFRLVDLGGDHIWANINAGATVPSDAGGTYALADSATATATVGEGWQLPSAADIDYLLNKCTWTTGTYNGQQGWMVSGSEKNSNDEACRLFLPMGDYWTSTPEAVGATSYAALDLTSAQQQQVYKAAASLLTIRPVGGGMQSSGLRIPYSNTAYATPSLGLEGVKIYNHAGPGANYGNNANGNLVLICPAGYTAYLHGNLKTQRYYDILRIYDKADKQLYQVSGETTADFYSQEKYLRMNFSTDGWAVNTGLDLILHLYKRQAHAIKVNTAVGGALTASATTSDPEQIITMKAQPQSGYLLRQIKIACADSTLTCYDDTLQNQHLHQIADTVRTIGLHWWNDYSRFYMPYSDVTLTPVFDKISSLNLDLVMPVSGTLTLGSDRVQELINAGITQLKFYDHGGPDGNYGDNIDSYMRIIAPEGYHMVFSGTIDTEQNFDSLYITDETTNTQLLMTSGRNNIDFSATTTGNKALLYFHTDRSATYTGYAGTVTFVKDE